MLNTLLSVNVEERVRQTLFNFLRRAQFAFREYALAREQTVTYLSNRESVSTYFLAIGHWEVFLYNLSKHPNNAIKGHQLAPGSTLAVWLTNEGLRCVDGYLTFEELAEILEESALWSDAAQDPLTMREKMVAHYAGDATGTEMGER